LEFEKLASENINEAKKKLAYVVTQLCHGEEKAANAMETAIKVFEQGMVGDDLPTITIEKARLEKGASCLDLFQEAGLTSSKGESRRLIRGKGAKVNDVAVTDENLVLDKSHVIEGVIKLSAGKKKHVLVKL
jgi:tyrosyl-tRNA synthetase